MNEEMGDGIIRVVDGGGVSDASEQRVVKGSFNASTRFTLRLTQPYQSWLSLCGLLFERTAC